MKLEEELEKVSRVLSDGFECKSRYCEHETSEKHYIVEKSLIEQFIINALESQMSDLRKEVEKLKKPDITMFKKLKCFFNIHGKDDWEMTRGMMMWCYKCHKPRV